MGLEDSEGHRFRLFLPTHPKAKERQLSATHDVWIYPLFAGDAGNMACYVGQTRNLRRRIREPWKRRFGKRAFGPVFAWAARYAMEVKFVVLQALHCTPSKAIHAEEMWGTRARSSGLLLPRQAFRLTRALQPPALPWPFDAVAATCQSIENLMIGSTTPKLPIMRLTPSIPLME